MTELTELHQPSPRPPSSRRRILSSPSQHEVIIRVGGTFSKCQVWVESENFYCDREAKGAFLLVGFDTEFKGPGEPVDRQTITERRAKYEVLSYQVWCSLHDPAQPEAPEWGGICYPREVGERLTLGEVLAFAIRRGIDAGLRKVPLRVYVVGHFTRADIPALADFRSVAAFIDNVRGTFMSVDEHVPLEFDFADGSPPVSLKVMLRDTKALAATESKSLAALGDAVGVPKIRLSNDPETEQLCKANMDRLLVEQPDLFERYALNDAVICVRYAQKILALCSELGLPAKLPLTLSGIGVTLAKKGWADEGRDEDELLGVETRQIGHWDKKRGHYIRETIRPTIQDVHYHLDLATECYHGGRNEQFWFGPGFTDTWTDWDLRSAYATAMAMIRTPAWREARVTLNVDDFTPTTLGYADVVFEFPRGVRFPTMPIRTQHGLIFTRKGRTCCAAPEIALALALGAELKIKHGVVVPYAADRTVFGEFIRDCLACRKLFPKGSLENFFWKELANSTYGKTAQGLRPKRVYDMRERSTKQLPPSPITNPFFAAFITSAVRAVLGEIMNSLPATVTVFNCTTDGFLSNATEQEIADAQHGPLVSLFEASRRGLSNDPTVLERKHVCRKPLGWRTRGQATLVEGDGADAEDFNFVLAKGGIVTPAHIDSVREKNRFILDLFLSRTPETVIEIKAFTGIREIVEFDADLVEKQITRRLNMEFDWKRRPIAVRMATEPAHLAFATGPWESVDEFNSIRAYWEDFSSDAPLCVKTLDDYHRFAEYVLAKSALAPEHARYLKKINPGLNRLRQSLCSAWRQSAAGLEWRESGMSAAQFAGALRDAGIECARADVENGARKPFVRGTCPPTAEVHRSLERLAARFPNLDQTAFTSRSAATIDMTSAIHAPWPYW